MKNEDYTEMFVELGIKIASIRKEHNLSQAELAGKIGVSQQLVAAYEKATRHLPLIALFRISKVLHVEVEELLGLKKRGKPGPPSKVQRLANRIKKLPSEKQKKVIEHLEFVIDGAEKN